MAREPGNLPDGALRACWIKPSSPPEPCINYDMRKHHFYKGKALDKDLRSIYEVRGKLPDMTRLEHEYHRRTTRVLLILVFFFAVLTAASWLGFFLFGASGSKNGEVELAFSGPTIAVSGVPQELTLSYKNRDRHPLAFGSLRLRLPQDLRVQAVDPQPAKDGTWEWNFGTLPEKSSGEIHLTVIPYGALDSNLEIQAVFSYKPANFNAEFQTLQTHNLTIQASPVALAIEGPANAEPGQELSFNVQMQNETDETFERLRATLILPTAFSLTVTEPLAPEAGWDVGTLAPGDKKEFAFKGSFLSGANGDQE